MKLRTSTRFCALTIALVMLMMAVAGCGTSSSAAPAPAPAPAASVAPVASEPAAPAAPAEPVVEKMEGDEFGNGAIGTHGGVSSCSPYASQAGIDILKAGGNAVDAAIATVFAAGVVEPNLSGIGGCGMMNIYLKDSKTYEILEYMETVPAAVTPGWFNPKEDVNTAKNAAVPGQVAGLLTALEKFGTMKPEQVMAPAIKLAREGFKMDKRLADAVSGSYDALPAEALRVYTNDGIPYKEGDLFKNPDLANTLEAVSKDGIAAFYTGAIGDKLIEGLQKNGSLMAKKDLEIYEAMERTPIKTTYHGYEVVTVPPPSNGGDWLLEMLNIMENYDLKAMGFNSPEYIFTFNEASRLGLSDSYAFIGDPAFYKLPIDQMISKEYAKERVKLMPTDKAFPTPPPAGDLPVEKLNPATAPDSLHTSHVAVIDQFGNVVSTTNTLGNGWGCKYMAEGLGFFLNSHINNLDHEHPDSPDYVMPGKRVRSTISPSFVLKDGEPILAIGSPGSLAIPPAIAMVINNVLLFDMNIQQAINAPRAMAIDRKGPTMTIEQPRFDPETVKALEAYGYEMKDVGEYNMAVGGIAAIYLDKETGKFFAGADPRRNYQALAY